MCSLLTILNVPLFLLYSAPADRRGVNFFNVNSMFTHFHLGNMGRAERVCQVSNLEHGPSLEKFDFLSPVEVNSEGTIASSAQKMHFKCFTEEEYLHKVIDWGFLYKLDLELEGFTRARDKCLAIDGGYEQDTGGVTYLPADDFLAKEEARDAMANSTESRAEGAAEEASEKAGGDTEYVSALMDPEMFPEETHYNIDAQCNFKTMFADADAEQ
jgi:hypothetical protein